MALVDRAFVIPSPVEESLTISSAYNDQRCLDFARHDKKLGCAIENTARSLAANFDVESETLHFLDQHVKRFRSARLARVITFHDRFVNPGAPLHVIGVHSKQFLKGLRAAMCFESPQFNVSESLAAISPFA